MKILQILPALELGGVERGTVDLARALKARGEGAVVVSGGGALVQELQRDNIPHYTLPVGKKSLFSLSLVPKLAEIIRRERVDIVHARSRVPAWLAWFAAREAGIPLITTCHGYYSTHALSRVMGWGKRVIVPSPVIARHMIEDFGVPPSRITMIPRGVDLTQFRFQADKYGDPSPAGTASRPPKIFRILNLGRLSPIKGHVEFLRAIHRVRRQELTIEVWIVGSEGEGKTGYTREIERTIGRLGLGKIVKLLGTRRDVPELLREADLLVLPSLAQESFGRVLIEAGAVGTACVATRVGGVLDIIEDEKEGLLVHPRDEEGLAGAITRALRDRGLSKRMAEALHARVEREFSLDKMVERTLEVYRQVKNEKRILVIKLGALGDVILAIPSLRMIRKKFPDAHLSLLVDSRFLSLAASCPYLNEVIPFDRKKARSWPWIARFAKRLRSDGFDLSIDLQNTKRTHLLAFLAGVPHRYGFRRGFFGRLLNHPDLTYIQPDSPVKHQFRVLSKLGINHLEEELELWPDRESEAKINQWFEEKRISNDKKIVGLVPGSSPRWPTKRWPVEHYHRLANQLVNEIDCQIVLIGTEEDQQLQAEAGRDESSDLIFNFVGKTSLLQLVSLIKRLDLLVAGDTAPLHVARAVGVPVVALFGPTDPRRHLEPGNGTTVLMKRLSCQPCYKGICHNPETLACLKRIEVDEVFNAVTSSLGTKSGDSPRRACLPARQGLSPGVGTLASRPQDDAKQ